MKKELLHPGAYVRQNVIPSGMNVTKAASIIEVSRPTLSNFLNGKADLSTEMAARLEAAFGVPARKLLDVQSAWDASKAKDPEIISAVRSFVPPFLNAKATDIETWASTGIMPRQRLSVFLRTLVVSTNVNLSSVDFPGNDDSERSGWDGYIVADKGSPWVPEGKSGWEFGVTADVKGKADGDFDKSVKAVPAPECAETTFVFVTPRRWSGKDDWVKAQRAKSIWKDVRAFDASDLEQWLDQSIPGQTWFANETRQESKGTMSLDRSDLDWSADCEPPLSPLLFENAIASYKSTFVRMLTSEPYKPIVISADSKDEALAFISAALSDLDDDLKGVRSRVVVFKEPGALAKIGVQVSNIIPVIVTREVEKEFAPFRATMPSIIVYPKNATTGDPDIVLDTLGWEQFNKALRDMGLEKDRIDQLSRESGRSPTVLRRRLSQLSAIRKPDWAADHSTASRLIPFVLAGVWDSENKTDRATLEILAGDVTFEELDRALTALLPIDATPVWATGRFRGVVSKIDALFAVHSAITTADLVRFFDIAELMLAEIDPALELPESEQWAAAIYGKTRELSGALREGLAESLVLLAVYGPQLLGDRLNFNISARVNRLVTSLLSPLTQKTLESQVDNLPLYSEAAPETFLSLIEADLDKPDSVAMGLMRPVVDSFHYRSPRTGLLWALENLAWNDRLFLRTVLVLGQLAERAIEDNLVNKPIGSLGSIFRAWMPQTGADLTQRKAALTKLAETHPTIAWQICLQQFSIHGGTGHYTHKPRWRPDGHGLGDPIKGSERNEFALFAFEMALAWPSHDVDTITSLIKNIEGVGIELRDQVWDVVERWIPGASDDDKAKVREQIRTSTQTRRAIKRREKRGDGGSVERASAIFDFLEPTDPILRHEWLFRSTWVDESKDELEEAEFNYEAREKRIAELRQKAIAEIFKFGGVEAVVALAERGQAAHNVGWFLATVTDSTQLTAALTNICAHKDLAGARGLVLAGAFMKSAEDGDAVLREVVSSIEPERRVDVLLKAPFRSSSWKLVDQEGNSASVSYWTQIQPGWNNDKGDQQIAVHCLIAAKRPRAAFGFIQWDLKNLPPQLLYDLLIAVASQSNEPPKTELLDQYHLREAFDVLNASGQFSTDEMASLEYQYIFLFGKDEARPVNLEKLMAAQPELFIQAVAFAFTRDDNGQDPPELTTDDEDLRSNRASHSYSLLDAVDFVPGMKNGIVKSEDVIAWVDQARSAFRELARVDIGDQMIGQALINAPADDDGIWPCLPVRDALERVRTEHIGRGIYVAFRNSRGAHWRGEGGQQEREIAAKYRRWADAMHMTHPRVSAILRGLEQSYIEEAAWEDNDAKIARRMRY